MRLLVLILIGALLAGCSEDSTQSSCPERPSGSSANIASIDDAFHLMLNSKDQTTRFSATLYLKSHLKDETVKHYGTLLFKVSHPPGRIKIIESMGFFGGSANATLLAHYLQTEGEVDAKVQIICSLGHIGPDAAQFVGLIEDVRDSYARLRATHKSQDRSIVIRSGRFEWLIRENSMSVEQFAFVVDESLKRIRGAGQGR